MKCPLKMSQCPESNDSEDGCPWWTILILGGEDKVGKCAVKWIPTLLIENRIAIDRLLKPEGATDGDNKQ